MIPRFKPYLGKEEFFALFRRNKNAVEEFEQKFAEKFECKYGIMFSYGRTGIYSLLKVWGLSHAEVICPAYTCTVVPHAIELSGNTPTFVDSQAESPNMDLESLELAITSRTRVIVFTHILGYPADVLHLEKIVAKAEDCFGHKIYVIQDVAHSFGCEWEEQAVCLFGDAAVFGLNISKVMTSISGGMIITSDVELKRQLSEFRESNYRTACIREELVGLLYFFAIYMAFSWLFFPLINLLERMHLINRFVKYYDESRIEFPKNWSLKPMSWCAKIGLVQLKKYGGMIQARRTYADYYLKNNDFKGMRILYDQGATYSQIAAVAENKKSLIRQCLSQKVQIGEVLEYVCPLLTCYRQKYGFQDEQFPNAKFFSEHIVNLPVSGKWNPKVAQKVVSVLQGCR